MRIPADLPQVAVRVGEVTTVTAPEDILSGLDDLAAARHVGVEPAVAIEALGRFAGVRRRMELRGEINGVRVYDDFAHHPTAIRTTLEGLRSQVGAARILAVLEPRSNTMKLGAMKAALPASLAAADAVFVHRAGLDWDPAVALATLGSRLYCTDDIERMAQAISDAARPGDHVLIMSNGSFGGLHDKVLARLANAGRGTA